MPNSLSLHHVSREKLGVPATVMPDASVDKSQSVHVCLHLGYGTAATAQQLQQP